MKELKKQMPNNKLRPLRQRTDRSTLNSIDDRSVHDSYNDRTLNLRKRSNLVPDVKARALRGRKYTQEPTGSRKPLPVARQVSVKRGGMGAVVQSNEGGMRVGRSRQVTPGMGGGLTGG